MPSRWAERQARRTRRCELGWGRTRASSRSPTAFGASADDPLLARVPSGSTWLQDEALGLDVLGDLAQADLAQRGQVLDPEEVVERGLDVLAGVDLPGAQAGDQRLGGEVDEDDLVGGAEDRVGHRLPHPHPGQLGDLVVERLEVLDVDGGEDVDPGREHVGDVLVALLVLEARRVGVGELVDQRQLGRAGEQRRQVHLLDDDVADRRPGAAAPPPARAPGRSSPGACAAPGSRSRRRGRRRPRRGPPAASGRSSPPRPPCRGRSCSGRGCDHWSPRRPHSGPQQVVDDEVDQLDADEGDDQAAEAVDQHVAAQQRRWRRSAGSGRRAARAGSAAG